ncbi:Ig-like domain-containing protein, partial [Methanosphaera sp.]|uniref:Ig-like domain-containing protein n=1 Tax=Methanosphaera sp. TaxID=2666342 RepID=UPI0025F175DF
VIEGNTLRNVTVIATGSNYVYGINVGRAKDTTIENVDIDVESDYYTNGIQLFDAVDITIDGTIDSTAATQAYGVYATAMAVGTSSGIDLTGLNITVESPDATGVLIEGASDVIIADTTYDIKGGNATAVNAHVDWMGNIPKNINITEMDIKINGTEDNNILYFGLCDGVTITECNIETTSGSEINFNKTSNAQVTNNYILIKDMMTGSFGNYAVITTENDTTVENNTPTSKLIDELNQQIEDLQNELDQLKAPKATTLTLDPVTDAKYNTNITISGTLVNEDSIGLFNQVVTLTIGDKTVDVTTKGGVFEYTTSFKTLEEQTVTATYAGTDKYNASEDTITFTLEKGDVIVTVDEITETAYGDNVTITGKFTTSDGKAISNSNVKITIDGKKYYAKTDKTGTYTLSVKASTVGENTITAGYSGNTNYNAYETTATFNVKAADAVVTYEPISDVTLGENVTITGTFKDANGKAVTNSNVKITINGKKYYAKTDSTGKYTLSVATTKEGVNNVTIGYSGSAKYNAFETSTTFTVLKAQ